MTRWPIRALLSLLLSMAVVLGVEGTANAAFTDREVAATSVGTATVRGVTGQSGTGTTCRTSGSVVSLTWTPSSTDRVNAYRLTDNGTTRATVNGRTSTSGSLTVPRTGGSHTVAIVAVTDYGWTATVAVMTVTC